MSLYYIDALSRKSPMLLLVQMLPSLIEIKSRQNFSLYQLSIQYLSNKKGKWGLGNAFQGLHVPPYCLHLLKKSITLTHPTPPTPWPSKRPSPQLYALMASFIPTQLSTDWVKALSLQNILNLTPSLQFHPCQNLPSLSNTLAKIFHPVLPLPWPWLTRGPLIFKAKVKTATPPLLSLQIWSGVCLHREPIEETWMTWHWQWSEI